MGAGGFNDRIQGFDPRLRDGGDSESDVPGRRANRVSIHASVMEATGVIRPVIRPRTVSIHASVMEATKLYFVSETYRGFRSTPP